MCAILLVFVEPALLMIHVSVHLDMMVISVRMKVSDFIIINLFSGNFFIILYLVLTDCGADNPCKNDGNCTRNSSTVICECESQYTGEYCQNLGKNKM